MEQLRDRVAVITGGASGIGLATAHRLAAEGTHLVLADIEQEALDAAVAGLAGGEVRVIGVRTDVSDHDAILALAERAYSEFGAVHILFNNAGVAISGPIAETTHADWQWVINVNLWGVIYGVEIFLPRMLAGGEEGHIISTASFAGLVPNTGLGPYCVTKYGVVALMETLFREQRGGPIGASVLCPMRVSTNIDASGRNRPEAYGGPVVAERVEQQPAGDLAGRTITADEVAEKVVRAIREKQLYILPHPESRDFVRRRFERIDRSYDL